MFLELFFQPASTLAACSVTVQFVKSDIEERSEKLKLRSFELEVLEGSCSKKARLCDQKDSGIQRQSKVAESTLKAFTTAKERQWHFEKDT